MNHALRDKFFSIVRSGMGLETESPALTHDECVFILKIAKRQSILSIVYQGLKNCQIPEEYYIEADVSRTKSVVQVIHQEDAMKRVKNALESAHIPYIPLKGVVLRRLYPRIEMRTSSDIDVLVREDDIEDAVDVIERTASFKMLKRNYHDVSMIDQHVHLELHFNIKENMDNIDTLLVEAWDYACPEQNSFCHMFTPEFQLFHIIAHMSYHMVHGGLGIRPFLDLWLLRNKMTYDEETILKMCSECNILLFYKKSCQMVDSWMSGNPLDSSLGEYEQYCLDGGVFGTSETVLASKRRNNRGAKYLWGRVFMRRSGLETEFPELKNKPYLLPAFQIKRWARLLSKRKRKQVRRELNDVHALSSDSVKDFDALLTSLGL